MSKQKNKDEMDDSWDDDGGGGNGDDWGEDDAGAGGKSGGGGDEDDWDGDGGDGGGATEEWENAEFDESTEMADDGDQELTVDIQIANIFYEAEDMVREHPKTALAKFLQVLDLCRGGSSDPAAAASASPASFASGLSDESRTALFSSLVHIVVLSYETGAVGRMVDFYQQLLSMIPRVTRNEAAEAIDAVLNAVSSSRDFGLLTRVYSITSRTLQSMQDTERMLFSVNMKLCRTHVDRHDYTQALAVLDQLHASCKLPNGEDDKRNKGAELIEIYALIIKISFATGDSKNLKHLYDATKDLQAAVKDPRSQSVIREVWGFMFGDDGEWQRAYTEFYSAFGHYAEIGNRERAKLCLKYVVIANMLAGGEQNPFDAREAKVFQQERDVTAIVSLRAAYERCDVAAFNAALADIMQDARAVGDTFIPHHLDVIVRDFQCRALCRLLKSYRRVRLDRVARQLQVDTVRVERLLVGLILDGTLVGRIDRVHGLLDLTPEHAANAKKFDAIEAWTNALSQLQQHITTPNMP